ncbi:MAG: helix-turn-helix transcriptional regulator [Flavobacteriaceae bacterium]|nr:helix-turn-helix transcriptional regulator [Flavobacteriaceae bacterium]
MNDKSYENWISMSDSAISKIMGEFIKNHRINQNRTQDEVAGSSGISRSTLSLLERGKTVTIATLIQVLRTLGLLHILEVFNVEQQISPIELAKKAQQKRQRSRPKENDEKPETNW